MSEEQAADIKPCGHVWHDDTEQGKFVCSLCSEEGYDQREPLTCPCCGQPPKIEQQWVVRCGNYNSCTMRPRTTGVDKAIAVAKWNQRSGENANRWALYERDKETGEVKQ